jgi:signal transduction histidine kinase
VRRVPLFAVMVALVGAVVAASLWTMKRADAGALRDIRAAQGRLAQESANALHTVLDSLDRDTRLLATLASGSRRQPIGTASQDRAILDAFQALAIVVPHYRTVALFHAGRAPIIAVDPTEEPARIVPGLVAASQKVADTAVETQRPARSGPLTLAPGRSFYLFAAPAGVGEAVVTTTDAPVMLEAASRRPTDGGGLIVLDPSGAVWIGCEHQDRCRLIPAGSPEAEAVSRTIQAGTRDSLAAAPPAAAQAGIPSRAIVGLPSRVESPLGTWSIVAVVPATDLDVKQRGFFWLLVVTSAGVAGAMLAVGTLMLRQHANAAELRARLQAAEEVARLQRQLIRAEKLVTVGVLSAGIAHEIGTPLAVVRGRAEHMLERRSSARDAEDLSAVVDGIDRISSKIRQVLEFSRDQPVTVGRTEVRPAIGRALGLLEWRLARKNVAVQVDAAPELPPLAATADQLEQVLVNLVMNACDASSAGSDVRISVGPDAARSDRLRLEIADRGSGIPSHHLNAVFDPYFTTKRRDEGTGLGLAIVSQIVRNHHGEITLRSAVGQGTVATVLWPIAETPIERSEHVA